MSSKKDSRWRIKVFFADFEVIASADTLPTKTVRCAFTRSESLSGSRVSCMGGGDISVASARSESSSSLSLSSDFSFFWRLDLRSSFALAAAFSSARPSLSMYTSSTSGSLSFLFLLRLLLSRAA
jgi:outer membrane protein TolC